MFSAKDRGSPDTAPARAAHPPSILSPDLTIEGNLVSDGDIQLDGRVTGDIHTRKLTVGAKAHVAGAILAEEVRVAGSVDGEITAIAVQLTASAKVSGDINHDSLAIEAGAFVQGLCRRMDTGQKRRVEETLAGERRDMPAKPSASDAGGAAMEPA